MSPSKRSPWYDDDYPGRGRRFYLALIAEATRIQEAPRSFPFWRRHKEVRVCVVPRFPFSVIFVAEADGVMVYTVAHDKRRPGTGRSASRRGSCTSEADRAAPALVSAGDGTSRGPRCRE